MSDGVEHRDRNRGLQGPAIRPLAQHALCCASSISRKPQSEDVMIPSIPRRLARLALSCLVLLPAVPAVRAAVAPEAKPVLERYLQAMGGQALLDDRSVHTRSTIEAFMMKGVIEAWTVRPDRYLTRLEIGPLKMSMGCDGQTGWRTDPGGKVLKLDGKDLEDVRGGAWFDTDGYLLPDQAGGSVTYAGEESDSAGRYAVLELTPPVGRARRAYFDLKTGLVTKAISKNDQQTTVTRLGDYRRVGRRMMSFHSTAEIVGQPMNTVKIALDSVWVNEALPADLFAPPSDQGSVRYLKTPGVARLPFEYQARHVWLRASVNGGPPADFIFDTGASITVIDSAYAAKIGLQTEGAQQGQGAGATGSASFAALSSLVVAAADGDGIEVKDARVAVLSVNSILAPYFWRDCAGVIGFDFISRFVDELDFDARRLTLRDPKTFQYTGPGTAIPMTLAGHTPVVTLRLDGRITGDFRVDAGSGSTVDLHTPFVKRHDLMTRAGRGVEVMGGGFGGMFTTRVVRMKKLEIGPYSWADPVVSLSQATAGAFTSEDYAGNIGNRILERFKVTLDYERRRMWLEPGKLYTRRDPMSRSGIQLVRHADTVKVAAVLAGSAAERAGLSADDVVTALDGRRILELGFEGVAAILDESAEGSTHTLAVVRAGKARKIRITLKEML
jgi:hypothetical protein